MTMHHPADERSAPDVPGLEARIPAVLLAVLATWVLIAAWKVVRQLMGPPGG